MAIRGKVKVILSTGNGYTGTVRDTANNIDYSFEQPLGAELGLVENMIVRMEVITKGDGTKLAICLDPVEKAKIESLDPANNTGTLKDNRGNIITFNQNYLTELGLKVGDKVSYAIITPPIPDDGGFGGIGGGTTGGGTGGGTALDVMATSLQKVS